MTSKYYIWIIKILLIFVFIFYYGFYHIIKLNSEELKNIAIIGNIIAVRGKDFVTIEIHNSDDYFLLKKQSLLYVMNLQKEIISCVKPIHFFSYQTKYYIHAFKKSCGDINFQSSLLRTGDFVFLSFTGHFIKDIKKTKKRNLAKQIPPKIWIHPVDKKEMIYIEEDYLLFGQGDNPYDSSFNPFYYEWNLENVPRILSFYMDKYEVTNQEFLVFCQKTNRKCPRFLYHLSGKEKNLPFIYATYQDVVDYAKWTKKQIPTEWEWELAAKGGLQRFIKQGKIFSSVLFPEYPSEVENCNTKEKWKSKPKLINVYELKDINFRGLVGLCGNALEWTQSYFLPYPGHRFRKVKFQHLAGKFYRVLKGGAFYLPLSKAKVYTRIVGGIPLFSRDPIGGFRLIVRTQ